MWKDEIIEALHQQREAHARQFNFDLQAICADLQAQEKNSGRHFVTRTPRRVEPNIIKLPQSEEKEKTCHPN